LEFTSVTAEEFAEKCGSDMNGRFEHASVDTRRYSPCADIDSSRQHIDDSKTTERERERERERSFPVKSHGYRGGRFSRIARIRKPIHSGPGEFSPPTPPPAPLSPHHSRGYYVTSASTRRLDAVIDTVLKKLPSRARQGRNSRGGGGVDTSVGASGYSIASENVSEDVSGRL